VLQQQGGRGADGVVQGKRPEEFGNLAEARGWNRYSRKHLNSQARNLLKAHIAKDFTKKEKENIYEVNREVNGGEIHSDTSDEILEFRDISTEPQVDHRYPKSKGGSNSYANAAVIPADENIRKATSSTVARSRPKLSRHTLTLRTPIP
jgi:hypothetical protein